MAEKNLKIIYMGTPQFAVEPLKKLYENGFSIVAVVTAPDKPAGRGHKLQESAIKQYAKSVGIPVLQPIKLKDPEFLKTLASYNADLQIVVAFRMLPREVWNAPPLGTFNLHASLLPNYRGAAPINWAIINGEKETGVTTFFLNENIDTGDIIFQEKLPINEDDDMGTMYDKLSKIGADLVMKTVEEIKTGTINRLNQANISSDQSTLKSAPKIFPETCDIDWSLSSIAIFNKIRGLSPLPGARAKIKFKDADVAIMVKIFKSKPVINPDSEMTSKEKTMTPGEILSDKKHLLVKSGDGFIELLSLQLPGKKRADASSILQGHDFKGAKFF